MTIDPAKINIEALLRFVEEVEDYAGVAAIFGPENGWGEPITSEPHQKPELHFVRSVNEDKSLGHWLKIYAVDFSEAASLSQKKGVKPVCIVRDAEM